MMRAVLFDMDGLLVDSERLWFEVETEVMAELGGSWGPEDHAELVGGSMERTVAYMLDRAGRNGVSPSMLAAWIDRRMVERLDAEVPLMPGVAALLGALRSDRVPTALVTNSRWPMVDAALKSLGHDRFDAVVTAEDVERPKPDAQPYTTAARRLDVDPAACVALEDSPSGAASATAAGCVVIAVPSVVPIDPAPRRVVRESLLGMDPAQLRRIHAELS